VVKKLDKSLSIGIDKVEHLTFEDVKKSLAGYQDEIPQLDPDLMYIRFIMAHEGANGNGDTFTNEVLAKAQYTPRHKPVNWEHGQPMIGTILESQYKEDPNGRGYIEAIGVIWKFIYPELAEEVKTKASTGELRLSMECYYKDASYKYGDNLYDSESAQVLNLDSYVGREYMGQKVYRIFTDVIFGGVGVVKNPADKEAVFLAVAKKKDEEAPIDTSDNTAIASDEKERAEHAITVAKIVKAMDDSKTKIVAKFQAEEINKESLVSEIGSELESLLDTVASVSTEYLYGKALASKDIGYKSILSRIDEILWKYFNSNDDTYVHYYIKDIYDNYIIAEIEGIDTNENASFSSLYRINYSVDGDVVQLDMESISKVKVMYIEASNDDERSDSEMDANKENVLENETEIAKANEQEEVKTEPVVAEEVAVEEVVNEELNEAKASIEELNKQIALFKEQLEAKDSEITSLSEKLGDFVAKAEELEKAEKLATRMASLDELGVSFSEERLSKEQAKISAMSDEDFEDYKSLLAELVTPVASSVEEVEVEIEDKSVASLNMETEVKNHVPFGHLRK
jgi:hypothetical protein